MEIGLYDHHPASPLTREDLDSYESLLARLPSLLLADAGIPPSPSQLPLLDEVEISLVDDDTIAQIHQDFMNIEGPTDVVTFHHGEIIISWDTTLNQARELNEPVKRELLRYMIHGFLHLHGYLDYSPSDRTVMFEIQERLLEILWKKL